GKSEISNELRWQPGPSTGTPCLPGLAPQKMTVNKAIPVTPPVPAGAPGRPPFRDTPKLMSPGRCAAIFPAASMAALIGSRYGVNVCTVFPGLVKSTLFAFDRTPRIALSPCWNTFATSERLGDWRPIVKVMLQLSFAGSILAANVMPEMAVFSSSERFQPAVTVTFASPLLTVAVAPLIVMPALAPSPTHVSAVDAALSVFRSSFKRSSISGSPARTGAAPALPGTTGLGVPCQFTGKKL